MLTRALSGIVFVAIVIGCIMWNHLSFVLLLIFVNAVGQYELYRNVEKQGKANLHGMDIAVMAVTSIAVLMYSNTLFSSQNEAYFLLIPAMIFAIFLRPVFTEMENGLNTLAYLGLGIVYVTLPMLMLQHWALVDGEYAYTYLIGGLVLIWANDVFAYLTGKFLGRHKMIERVSPKKTWEGFAGAVAVALLAGVLLAIFMLGEAWWVGLILAGAMIITATVGDLTESLVKRDLGIKDISTWLPGHGGFLDRLDSILPSTVAAYLVYLAFGAA